MVVPSVDEAVRGPIEVLKDDVPPRGINDRVLLRVKAHLGSFTSSRGGIGSEDLLLVRGVEEAVRTNVLARSHQRGIVLA